MSDQPNTAESGQSSLNQLDATKQGIYELSDEELNNIAGGGWMGDTARFLRLDKPINFVANLLHGL
jgi:bacteriocin-like protein